MTAKKDDPTVRTLRGAAPEYPEGTHPLVAPSEQTWGPGRFSYSDMPAEDKPDESTVAQVMETDPIEEKTQKALADSVDTAPKSQDAKK